LLHSQPSKKQKQENMPKQKQKHIPVLLNETLQFLSPQKGKVI
jgi:hypothetical protein